MARVIEFTIQAKEDIDFFRNSGQSLILKKIRNLVEQLLEEPFTCIGKPEPLRFQLTGLWSRRINKEHRLVYEVEETKIIILSCRSHY
jgi:toxin YoeB